MLKEGFSTEAVARLTELPLERIVQLKLELDASAKNLSLTGYVRSYRKLWPVSN
jgi:hypothetical protein